MQKIILCSLLMLGGITHGVAAQMNNKIVYGYVEKATLVEKNLSLSAKLDTGAKSASLSAIKIKKHTHKDGKVYLTFDIPTKVGLVPFQAEFVGQVRIKPRVDERLSQKPVLPHSIHRPMVKIKLKLGNNIQEIRVNLTNRKRFLYPLLLGREAIVAFDGVVDPSHAFLLKK